MKKKRELKSKVRLPLYAEINSAKEAVKMGQDGEVWNKKRIKKIKKRT
jgi:hypothetical protein